jgi:tetratricopeptide (TPR) repeat protein
MTTLSLTTIRRSNSTRRTRKTTTIVGDAYGHKGNYDREIADENKAIALRPDYGNAYYNRGNAYDDKGDFDRAIDDYSKAIELNPQDADAYYSRGVAYRHKGDYDHAIDDTSKAIELSPNAGALRADDWADCKSVWTVLAIRGCSNIIKAGHQSRDELQTAYSNRGLAYRAEDDYNRAIADYDKAIGLDPRDGLDYMERAFAYEKKGDLTKALTDFLAELSRSMLK